MAYDTTTPAAAFVKTGFTGGAYQREMTTVYEIVNDATGKPAYAQPAFQFQYGLNGSVTTPCLLDGSGNAISTGTFNPGVAVACAANIMNWKGYQYPGCADSRFRRRHGNNRLITDRFRPVARAA